MPPLCSNLAEAHFHLNDTLTAQHYAEESLAKEERQFTPYAFFTLAEIARQQLKFKQACQYFEQSIAIAEENDDRFMLAYALRGLGQSYQTEGNHQTGQSQIERAAEIFKQLGLEQEHAKTVEMIKVFP